MRYNFDIFKRYQPIQNFFSQKENGSMKIASDPILMEKISRNRKKYFLEQNIIPKKVVSAEILHRDLIKIVGAKDGGKVISGADGLITLNKDIYLSITSADCLPIFFFEPEKEIVGMVHAGWRSLEKNILANAIKKIKELGGQPENILVGIGPSICQRHYEIGPEVAKKFTKYPETIRQVGKKIYLDIKKIAELQLLELGLEGKNIEISPECTFEFPGKYFSARRDQKKEVEAMMSLIGMRSL
jgi:polyphenol oxidase